MQNVISEIREKLDPILGQFSFKSGQSPQILDAKYDAYARLVRKVPQQNYEKLPKLVPISWL